MTEIERPRERESINASRSDTYVARIFLQTPDALNPDRALTALNVDDLEFGEEKADLLNRASVHIATDYWRKKDGGNLSYDEQMKVFKSKWAQAGRNRYSSLLKDGNSDEFKDEKAASEVAYLAKIGIDLKNFDEKAVQDFYDKYLDNGRDLKGFIDTLFYAEGVEREVVENIDSIKFLAGMFDRETSLDIEGILPVVASDDLEGFREKAINNPRVMNQAEKERLRLLTRLMSSESKNVQEESVVKKTSKKPDGSAGKPPETLKVTVVESTARVEEDKDTLKPVTVNPTTVSLKATPAVIKRPSVPSEAVRVTKADAERGNGERKNGGDGGGRPVAGKVDGGKLVSVTPSQVEKGLETRSGSGARVEARSYGYRLATAEDLIRVEESIKDKDHVHVHPQAFVIPDTHGLGAEGIVSRIREIAGKDADVQYLDGKVNINGQEAHIYGLGDMIDLNKSINRQMFVSEEDLKDAAENSKHPWHKIAVSALNDIQTSMQERARYEEHWKNMSEFNRALGYDFWKSRIEDGQVVLGNHELMMLAGLLGGDKALMLWLNPQNRSDVTYRFFSGQDPNIIAGNALRQAGVDLSKFTSKDSRPLNQSEYLVRGKEVDLTADMAKELRKYFLNSKRGKDFMQLLLKNFKLYNIVNGVLLTHAGIPIDENGNLVAPESAIPEDVGIDKGKKEFEAAIAGRRGIELYDVIEKMVRNSEPGYQYAILFLGYGSSDNNSPVFMRKGFQNAMSGNGDMVLSQLNDQMIRKGGPKITRIMVGHTPSDEGQMWGSGLLGADDKRGSAVRLEVLAQDAPDNRINLKVEVDSRHNFGQKDSIQSPLEPAIIDNR